MPTALHLVYSRRPDTVSEADYNTWYDFHLSEILVVPGFVSARRYALSPDVVEAQNPIAFTHLSLYEVEGDVDDAMKALWDDASQGAMQLPEWFEDIHFASWNATPLGETVRE
jgi:hypothetical protein